ncbi:MAG: hypothetical protein HY841_12025 [Bacteroidetes bacterium]|nr:hypothetical protein [Bacteroidota bacterium]
MSKKNLPKIVLALNTRKMDTPTLVSSAKGIILTGDPDATAPPVPDTTLHAQADSLLLIHTKRQTKPPTATADQETQQRNIVDRSYKKDGLYVQGVCNDVAVANGDVTAGEAVAQRIGYTLKKQATFNPTDFGVTSHEPGLADVQAKKAKKGTEAHLWRYGITPAKDTAPTALKTLVTVEAHIIIQNLPSGSILGIQHASVLPVSHTKKTSAAETKTSKIATQISLSKAKHPVFSHLSADPYQWTNFVYTGIL